MSDVDLTALQQQFRDTETELAAHVATLPTGMAIARGEVEISPADQARWTELQARLTDLAGQLHDARKV